MHVKSNARCAVTIFIAAFILVLIAICDFKLCVMSTQSGDCCGHAGDRTEGAIISRTFKTFIVRCGALVRSDRGSSWVKQCCRRTSVVLLGVHHASPSRSELPATL